MASGGTALHDKNMPLKDSEGLKRKTKIINN